MVIVDDIINIIMIVTIICIVYQGGWTALMYVSSGGHKEMVQLLLDHGAGTDIKDNVSIIYMILNRLHYYHHHYDCNCHMYCISV